MSDSIQKAVIVLLFVAVSVMGYFYYASSTPKDEEGAKPRSSGLMKTEAEFRDKLTSLNMQRKKAQDGMERLVALKSKAIQRLKEKGIKSGADYMQSDDKDVKFAAMSLKEYKEQIDKLKQEVTYYDDAITAIRAMLQRFERERIGKSVELSEEQLFELQKIVIDLEERLNVETDIFEDEEIKALLDDEMNE